MDVAQFYVLELYFFTASLLLFIHHDVHDDHDVKLRTTRRKASCQRHEVPKRRDRRVRRGE